MKYIKAAVFAAIENELAYSAGFDTKGKIGCRVIVPLGAKYVTAVITAWSSNLADIDASVPADRVKPVKELVDEAPVLNDKMMKLGKWVSGYYLSPLGLVYAVMLSALTKSDSKTYITLINKDFADTGLTPSQENICEFLLDKKGNKSELSSVEKATGLKTIRQHIRALEKAGVVEVEEKARMKGREDSSAPYAGEEREALKIELNEMQEAALARINSAIDGAVFSPFLLMGVTGSGKTEVYVRAAQNCVSKGRQAIVLVPEIFLTPQAAYRFKEVFKDRVAIFHSGLKDSERGHEWERMRLGKADVVVGTRSAVFAPFEKTGLIIVDEEFDSSYKQENDPRYSARDTAVYRASLEGAAVVLGSATPSLETWMNAKTGKYTLLEMNERVLKRPMPEIVICDLRYDGNKNMDLFLSDTLIRHMNEAVEAGEQAILFINRRGFSSFISCRECGYTAKCVNCEIPLVYHKPAGELKCHYCDYSVQPEIFCPSCKKPLKYKGVGTQRIEDVILKFFPDKKIMRVDIDTMKADKRHFEAYEAIKNGQIDILIGTQMIAKGFDFPSVTFVGVVGIDSLLNLPDFRSEERVFQLLTQVAGRTGRGSKPGKVVIQTYNPDCAGVKYIRDYDFKGFYEEQEKVRRAAGYPPFKKIMQIVIQNESESACSQKADKVSEVIERFIEQKGFKGISLLGPAPAPLPRLRGKYRYSMIVKADNSKILNAIGRQIKAARDRDVAVVVDPVNIL